jgi:hypothetical protein
VLGCFPGSPHKTARLGQEVETPISCADIIMSSTPGIPPPSDPEALTGADNTNEKNWLGDSDNPKTQSSGKCARRLTSPILLYKILAENYGDPSGKLWSMYLTEAAKEDDQMTKNWTKDTQGVLTFVSC